MLYSIFAVPLKKLLTASCSEKARIGQPSIPGCSQVSARNAKRQGLLNENIDLAGLKKP
jgi:hypothetical protein